MSDVTASGAVAAQVILLAQQVADDTLADANRLAAHLLGTAERQARQTVDAARRSAERIADEARGAVAGLFRSQHGEILASLADSRRELHALVEASLLRIEKRTDELAGERRAQDERSEAALERLLRALARERARAGGGIDGGRPADVVQARAAHPAGSPRQPVAPTPALASVQVAGRPPRGPSRTRPAPVIELVRPRKTEITVAGTTGPTPKKKAPAGQAATRPVSRRVAAG